MALVALARMMGRRLALRKGLAVSAAVLLLLGWCLLYAATHSLGEAETKLETPVPVSRSDLRAGSRWFSFCSFSVALPGRENSTRNTAQP